MAEINLGNAVGLVAKAVSPTKRYIHWAKTDSESSPNYYEIYTPQGTSGWKVLFNDGYDKEVYLYQPGYTYNNTDDRYAYYGFKLWKSLQVGNIGNTPVEGSYWTNVPIAIGAIIPDHQVGVYGDGQVIVAHPTTGIIYELKVNARPFESTDLAAEILSGNWAPLSGELSLVTGIDEDLVIVGPGRYIATPTANRIFTLPDLTENQNKTVTIKNRNSSGFYVSVQRAGTDEIFTSSVKTVIALAEGESLTFIGEDYWTSID
jgi:hypothetical protein